MARFEGESSMTAYGQQWNFFKNRASVHGRGNRVPQKLLAQPGEFDRRPMNSKKLSNNPETQVSFSDKIMDNQPYGLDLNGNKANLW